MGTPEKPFARELAAIEAVIDHTLTLEAVGTVRAAFEQILAQTPDLEADPRVQEIRSAIGVRETHSRLIADHTFFLDEEDERPQKLNPASPTIASIIELARQRKAAAVQPRPDELPEATKTRQ